jgi:hypothetical protein
LITSYHPQQFYLGSNEEIEEHNTEALPYPYVLKALSFGQESGRLCNKYENGDFIYIFKKETILNISLLAPCP